MAAVQRVRTEIDDYMRKVLQVAEQQLAARAAEQQAQESHEQRAQMQQQMQQEREEQDIRQAAFERYKASMQAKQAQFKSTEEVDKEHEVRTLGSPSRAWGSPGVVSGGGRCQHFDVLSPLIALPVLDHDVRACSRLIACSDSLDAVCLHSRSETHRCLPMPASNPVLQVLLETILQGLPAVEPDRASALRAGLTRDCEGVMALIKPLVLDRCAQADRAVLHSAVQQALGVFHSCMDGIPPGCCDVTEVEQKCKVRMGQEGNGGRSRGSGLRGPAVCCCQP